MSKGIAAVKYAGSAGSVMSQDSPNWDFIYVASLVKSSEYELGDRVVLPDGREFHYAKSKEALKVGQGCEFVAVGVGAYTVAGVSQVVGDQEITQPAVAHDAFAKDELRGGYCVIYNGVDNDVQFRGIVGNDTTLADVAFKVYLDGRLTEAVTAAVSAIECFQNPYASLQMGADVTKAKAGVPATVVNAADMYFWVQKAGPTWVAPQLSVIDNEGLGCFWRHDGTLQDAETALGATVPAFDTAQYAGHLIEGDAAGIGPLFMLQG